MATCPLCSDILLRHLRSGKPYWLCRRCRVEILEKKDVTAKNYLAHEVSPKTLSTHMPVHQTGIQLPTLEHKPAVGHIQQPPITTDI